METLRPMRNQRGGKIAAWLMEESSQAT